MGKRGPRPMPTAFRLIRGTDKPSRINQQEAQPQGDYPTCPDWLSPAAKAKWAETAPRMIECGLLTSLDGDALAAYCTAFAIWQQAQMDADKISAIDPVTHGVMTRTANGTPIQSPMLGAVNSLRREVSRLAAELGLTPAGRTAIKVDRPAGARSSLEAKYRA